jgi:hypothetical protein
MARIRSVHPEQWSDEQFVSCSPLARLLAIGLRNEADDNGVFEWNLFRLKVRVLPADNCDITELLGELVKTNQIFSYETDGKAYGLIRNFQRFQRPKEPSFKYPLPAASIELPQGYSFHKSGPLRPDISPPLPQDFPRTSPPLPQDFGKTVSEGVGVGEGGDVPTTSGASAPVVNPPAGQQPIQVGKSADPVFGDCLQFLVGKGCAERGARSFLGLMRKTHGDVAVVQAIEHAEREDISEPIPWLRKYLEGHKATPSMGGISEKVFA